MDFPRLADRLAALHFDVSPPACCPSPRSATIRRTTRLSKSAALADPKATKEEFAQVKESELGETLTRSRQWISALETLGHYDPKVRANHPTAVAFKNAYVIYNPTKKPMMVTFTDGKMIQAAPGLSSTIR